MLRVRVPAIQVRGVTPGQPRTRHVLVTAHRYEVSDSRGDRVEAVIVEPGSIFIRSHDGSYAAFFDGPPKLLRLWLTGVSVDYMADNLMARAGHRGRVSKRVAEHIRKDIVQLWPHLVTAIREGLALDEPGSSGRVGDGAGVGS